MTEDLYTVMTIFHKTDKTRATIIEINHDSIIVPNLLNWQVVALAV